MNKTFLPKTGLGVAGMGEGSVFSELDWWQQELMRQGLESGLLSDLTPQGMARAEAVGTALLLGPTQPGYPGVDKTISVPRPYVAFKRLGRTLALGRAEHSLCGMSMLENSKEGIPCTKSLPFVLCAQCTAFSILWILFFSIVK